MSSTPNVPGTTHAHHAEPFLRSRWATRSPKTPITALITDESTTTRTKLTQPHSPLWIAPRLSGPHARMSEAPHEAQLGPPPRTPR
jgi:hypothetical protein